MSKREHWNKRYAAEDLVWGAEPDRFLEAELAGLPPRGRALDLACGEGRNAIWLASRGWRVTAIDFSAVAIERARKLAAAQGAAVEFLCDDVAEREPERGAFALVVILYLQIPRAELRGTLTRARAALAPGGELLMVGHALPNLTRGVGGPQDPEVLWEPDALAAELTELGLAVSRAELARRPVEAKGDAIDALLRARAPR